jgi:hypothetical protein
MIKEMKGRENDETGGSSKSIKEWPNWLTGLAITVSLVTSPNG